MARGGDLPKNANTRAVVLPQLRPSATLLIGATCLGSGIVLASGRQALVQLAPPLTPASSSAALRASTRPGASRARARTTTRRCTTRRAAATTSADLGTHQHRHRSKRHV